MLALSPVGLAGCGVTDNPAGTLSAERSSGPRVSGARDSNRRRGARSSLEHTHVARRDASETPTGMTVNSRSAVASGAPVPLPLTRMTWLPGGVVGPIRSVSVADRAGRRARIDRRRDVGGRFSAVNAHRAAVRAAIHDHR